MRVVLFFFLFLFLSLKSFVVQHVLIHINQKHKEKKKPNIRNTSKSRKKKKNPEKVKWHAHELTFVLTEKKKRGQEKYYTIFKLNLYVEFYRRKIKKTNKA
jgi:hypothetical protein